MHDGKVYRTFDGIASSIRSDQAKLVWSMKRGATFSEARYALQQVRIVFGQSRAQQAESRPCSGAGVSSMGNASDRAVAYQPRNAEHAARRRLVTGSP